MQAFLNEFWGLNSNLQVRTKLPPYYFCHIPIDIADVGETVDGLEFLNFMYQKTEGQRDEYLY